MTSIHYIDQTGGVKTGAIFNIVNSKEIKDNYDKYKIYKAENFSNLAGKPFKPLPEDAVMHYNKNGKKNFNEIHFSFNNRNSYTTDIKRKSIYSAGLSCRLGKVNFYETKNTIYYKFFEIRPAIAISSCNCKNRF